LLSACLRGPGLQQHPDGADANSPQSFGIHRADALNTLNIHCCLL
jgi:hypothetical protein